MIERYLNIDGELKLIKIPQTHKGLFKKNGKKKYLNNQEIIRLIELYPIHFNYQLAQIFNCSEACILSKKRKFNLGKSPEIMNEMRFKPGHIPWNKNTPHPNKNSGQFQKGHTPKNHFPIGTIHLRSHSERNEKYFYIKIAEPRKWELLHRHLWKEKFGEIPPGKLIVFKDRNIHNWQIENLEMIDRKENLRRNVNRKKASESMRQTWRKEKIRVKYGLKRRTKLQIS
jgi:hypothetical protein